MMSLSSLALRTACRSSCRAALFASSFPLPAETPITAIDKLHQVIETFRMTNFPQTVPHEFVDQVVTAADENKDGRISVDEMSVMLRNIYSHQPISREEVQYIMEIDLGMNPDIEDSVPMEKVKQLLLEIYH
mmetsp:Transcript_6659/g.12179  ORF Transcript_6659/g.12179 Transcript_6659/m.12179 type:complete len:132 (-) Transcript_6659:44-439(-)|eukprot:CAMPEP_0202505620 /NCGR_PEP_ID=MMETSP1361-20130828/47680_1 /ASSEMBLY_ACC=CAM_ASM_000849 /TAXON_ID=210615 /ORGANISM="Staurosira complex sp., Strain CCMP2646" /LENGTH=131 /DNA_ID=CAMNT_0049139385 /DNA_START=227 /DNA_END=622 /DNA_ORIENTATION=-